MALLLRLYHVFAHAVPACLHRLCCSYFHIQHILQVSQNVGHFAYKTFRLLDTSPTTWTVRLLDISPTGHFAYSVDSSPTQREHKRMKMCDIHCVPKKTSRCLVVVGDHVIHLNFGGHSHKLRLSSSVIGGEMSCRRNVQVVGEVSSRRTVQ